MIADHDPKKRVGFWKFADTWWSELHPYQLGSIIRYHKDEKKVEQAWTELVRKEKVFWKSEYYDLEDCLRRLNNRYHFYRITLPPEVIKELVK